MHTNNFEALENKLWKEIKTYTYLQEIIFSNSIEALGEIQIDITDQLREILQKNSTAQRYIEDRGIISSHTQAWKKYISDT